MHPERGIYIIIDEKANDIVGPPTIHKHSAAAIRFFSDVAAMRDSTIGRHPEDYTLVRIGFLNDHHQVVPEHQEILTGAQWAATNNRQDDLHTEGR